MKSMSLILVQRNGDGFNDDKQPEDGQRPHGDIHRTAVCILFRRLGVSIMKRIGQMNQFVESAKEESGQKVTFCKVWRLRFLEALVRLTISPQGLLSSTK
jgi:hypothetical protein